MNDRGWLLGGGFRVRVDFLSKKVVRRSGFIRAVEFFFTDLQKIQYGHGLIHLCFGSFLPKAVLLTPHFFLSLVYLAEVPVSETIVDINIPRENHDHIL